MLTGESDLVNEDELHQIKSSTDSVSSFTNSDSLSMSELENVYTSKSIATYVNDDERLIEEVTTSRSMDDRILLNSRSSQKMMKMKNLEKKKKNDDDDNDDDDDGKKRDGLLQWERFNQWIHSILNVHFHLETGQRVNSIHPSHQALSDMDKSNIAYLAFPDSNASSIGDTQYYFRMPFTSYGYDLRTNDSHDNSMEMRENIDYLINDKSRQKRSTTNPTNYIEAKYFDYNKKSSPLNLEAETSHIYGYVYFRQVRDKTIKRGYQQESLVLLSHLPFHNLFSHVLSIIAPYYFSYGITAIDSIIHLIDQWPSLTVNKRITLPIMGTVINTSMTSDHYEKENEKNENFDHEKSLEKEQILKMNKKHLKLFTNVNMSIDINLQSIHHFDASHSLLSLTNRLHILWQMVLVGEPILVFTSTPSTCSEIVQILIDIIRPIKSLSDYRPYFTVHDPDFHQLTTKRTNIYDAAPIIGVTNPLFLKCIKTFPNTLHVKRNQNDVRYQNKNSQLPLLPKQMSIKKNDGKLFTSVSSSVGTSPSILIPGQNNKKKNFLNQSGIKQLWNDINFQTQFKSFLDKDKELMRELEEKKLTHSTDQLALIIRQRYLLLTKNFLFPIEQYIATLLPWKRAFNPIERIVPKIKRFDNNDFFKHLSKYVHFSNLSLKGEWINFYKHFILTQNFCYWFEQRRKEIEIYLLTAYLNFLSDLDIKEFIEEKISSKSSNQQMESIMKGKKVRLNILKNFNIKNRNLNNNIGDNNNNDNEQSKNEDDYPKNRSFLLVRLIEVYLVILVELLKLNDMNRKKFLGQQQRQWNCMEIDVNSGNKNNDSVFSDNSENTNQLYYHSDGIGRSKDSISSTTFYEFLRIIIPNLKEDPSKISIDIPNYIPSLPSIFKKHRRTSSISSNTFNEFANHYRYQLKDEEKKNYFSTFIQKIRECIDMLEDEQKTVLLENYSN
ncbi:hypothetical protein SNEBB_006616 [Seison nebaliae]|nr:hypothetical protein SNEBB_006616 [Seison nebaliae]